MAVIKATFQQIVGVLEEILKNMEDEDLSKKIKMEKFKELKEFSRDLKKKNVKDIIELIEHEIDPESLDIHPKDFVGKVVLEEIDETTSDGLGMRGEIILYLPRVFVKEMSESEKEQIYYEMVLKDLVKEGVFKDRVYQSIFFGGRDVRDLLIEIARKNGMLIENSNIQSVVESIEANFKDVDLEDYNSSLEDLKGKENIREYCFKVKEYAVKYADGVGKCKEKLNNLKDLMEKIDYGVSL